MLPIAVGSVTASARGYIKQKALCVGYTRLKWTMCRGVSTFCGFRLFLGSCYFLYLQVLDPCSLNGDLVTLACAEQRHTYGR